MAISKLEELNLNRLFNQVNTLIDYQKPLNLNDGSVNGTIIGWNVGSNYNAYVTLSTNSSLILNNLTEGDYGTLLVTQDSTGSRTLSLPANSKVSNGGGGSITLSTTADSIDILSFYYQKGILYWNLSANFT